MLRLLHPRPRRLSLYLDGEFSRATRARIAEHLAGCVACRDRVVALRAVDDLARDAQVPEPPLEILDRVLRLRGEGREVIVPTADPPAVSPRRGRRALSAAAAMVALASVLLLWPHAELEATRGELQIYPGDPKPGAFVRIEYRPGPLLAGREGLRLRGRFRWMRDLPVPETARQHVLATLERGADGLYRGVFQLPDSAAYAALAVESATGDAVDANGGRLWEVLAHARDGRPLYQALVQKQLDQEATDWQFAYANARLAARLYPEVPVVAYMLYMDERAAFSGSAADSARARTLARLEALDRRFRARERLDVDDELGMLDRLSAELGDSARYAYWRGRLLREAPNSLWGVQERVLAGAKLGGRPNETLDRLEALWREVGLGRGAIIYVPLAVSVARAVGDPALIRLWVGRASRLGYGSPLLLATTLTQYPALRSEGMSRLRELLRRPVTPDDSTRPLRMTAAEYALTRRGADGKAFAALGAALLESGDTAAALDTLGLAIRTGWDAALFRRVASLRLQAGDTVGALEPLALASVDPVSGAPLADSARVLLGSRYEPEEWLALRSRAAEELRERVLLHQVRRAVRGNPRMRDTSGRVVRLASLRSGRPTLVAFWYRYCPPSAAQLPQLEKMAAGLRAAGFAVITVTSGDSAELSRFMSEKHLTFPVYHDYHGETTRALDALGTPAYFVLDSTGDVRFANQRELAQIPGELVAVSASTGLAHRSDAVHVPALDYRDRVPQR